MHWDLAGESLAFEASVDAGNLFQFQFGFDIVRHIVIEKASTFHFCKQIPGGTLCELFLLPLLRC